jgi:hypothetical protein
MAESSALLNPHNKLKLDQAGGLKRGIYFVTISTGEEQQTIKVSRYYECFSVF